MTQRNHMMSAHRLADVRHGHLLGISSCTPPAIHVNQPWRTTVPMNHFLYTAPKNDVAVPYDTSNVGRKNIRHTGTAPHRRVFKIAADVPPFPQTRR
jgi:hypothetical protein